MGFFDSITKLTKDVADIALAPVEVATDLTRIATKPVADLAKSTTEVVKEMADEITEEGE